jgi:3-hydroxyacyl-CoA dehydrogenase
MGIFAVDDMAGIDVMWRVKQEFQHIFESAERKPLVADKLCELGRYGQKTGAGWYKYGENRKPQPDPVVLDLIRQTAQEAGIRPRVVSDEEILERSIYPMINEGAKILEEKKAIRPSDIDVVWVNGYGWPVYRGGPMHYADSIGLDKVLAGMKDFQSKMGDQFKPSALLENLVADGRKFADVK